MIFKQKIHQDRARDIGGFTLVETLFAVLILATAIVGPMTIASKGLSVALITKDQLTASFLAEDAIEFIHFARDTNRLAGNDWLAGSGVTSLTNCVGTNACYFDSLLSNPSAGPTSCGAPTCSPTTYRMNFDTTNKNFTYQAVGTGIARSIFTRTVTITSPVGTNADEALVTVKVQWVDAGGVARSITMVESIFKWQ